MRTFIQISGGFPIATTAAVLLSLLAFACDTQVEPFLSDREPPVHVVNGVLDAARDTQFVRVQAVKRTIEPAPAVLGEMEVQSSNSFEAPISWRDSVIVLDDGSTGHLFFAVFRPAAGATYRLRVSGAAGSTTVATTVPPEPEMEILPPTGTKSITQTIAFSDRRGPPPNLRVVYDVEHPVTLEQREFAYSYRTFGRSMGQRWEFDVLLSVDRRRIDDDFELAPADSILRLNSALVTFELQSPEWDSVGVSAEPGFFGAIGVYDVPLEWPDSIRTKLRFLP